MHPTENDLALYSSGDTTFVQTFRLNRHVANCETCREAVTEYRAMTQSLAEEPAIPNWDALSAEMSANIRLGLEAGACVQPAADSRPAFRFWNPRLTLAAASLVVLAAAGLALRQTPKPLQAPLVSAVKVDTEGVTITSVYSE